MVMDPKLMVCAILLLLLCLQTWHRVDGVQFEVSSRTTKCVTEEIQRDVLAVVDYKIVFTSSDNLSVTAKVTSPYGNQLYHQENVQSGQFAFTSKESGNHMACFWLQNAPPNVNVNLALDWKTGVSAKDWASIAKKDKLEVQSPILDLQLFFAVTLIF
jgi:hypothetical protein